ncbi:FAD/FMN-dependent dehydrogenase [Xenococcus sp. PCC 7305]|nr:FAD/FMN-dependent dehydrogenase [Xenococcus sp. PCC 7305]
MVAAQLQSIINAHTQLEKVSDSTWQPKIAQTVTDSTDAIYLAVPETVADLATIIEAAAQEKWRIIPCGNGSKLDWGSLTEKINLVVSTQKCDRIIDHAEGDLTVTVEAGVQLADLQAKLQATGQFLPIDPIYPQEATIGGIVATADTGSLRHGYGGIRDLILGISFVRADGKIAKGGGRVVKNVAGYDLMKLFTGSYGSLGIISQVTFRTYPIPATAQTFILTGDAPSIATAIKQIKNSGLTPTAADLVTGSVSSALELGNKLGLLVRFQTIPESIAEQGSQLDAIAQSLDLSVTSYQEETEAQIWQKLSELIRIPQSSDGITCKLGILPSSAVQLFQELAEISPTKSLARIHIGSGLGSCQWLESDRAAITRMRSLCQQQQGFLTVLSAAKSVKQEIDIWGYSGNTAIMMQKIKQQFDPQNIFNPQRYVE